jgi:hypothetical protein
MMRFCGTGIERECPAELGLGPGPVPVVIEPGIRQRAVRLGQRVVERQRFQRGGLGFRNCLVRWHRANIEREAQ